MGMLVDGRWSEEDRRMVGGAFERAASAFGEPLGDAMIRAIEAEPQRFWLIASTSCPWSHRATLVRAMKGLDIGLRIATGPRTQGYRVGQPDTPWTVPGLGTAAVHLHALYTATRPDYTGRPTVPVLWDAAKKRIVSNESAHIVDGLDRARTPGRLDWTLRPAFLMEEIDVLNERLQARLSNAVYRAGKAQRQNVYDEAVDEVFETLSVLEDRLAASRYLHGDALTTSDIRLWPTLARFDAVYHGHFKCSRRRLTDFPHLWAYARDLMAWPSVAETFDEPAIRAAYYGEDRDINPHGVVATRPDVDWAAPHGRESLGERRVFLRTGETASLDEAA